MNDKLMERLESKIDSLIKEVKRHNEILEYQSEMLEKLTTEEMIRNQTMIKEIHDHIAVPPEKAFMINVNANLWASLFEKYYWGEGNE